MYDEEQNRSFSLTPSPKGENGEYIVNFGFGFSKFSTSNLQIDTSLTSYIPEKENVKVNIIKLKNNANFKRNIKLVFFINLGMEVREDRKNEYIDVYKDDTFNIVYANNRFKNDFKDEFVYISSSEKIRSFTGLKDEFIGGNDLKNPRGLTLDDFSNCSGIGKDNIAVIRLKSIELKENEEKNISIILGSSNKKEIAKDVAYKYYKIQNCLNELTNIKEFWNDITNKIQVNTPCETTNLLLNGWLIYQTISSRLWGKSGFYQSGGAYGFRDQLQDVLSLVYIRPDLTKKQILEHAKHQFVEGDVEHWWHKETSKGIRTRFSDDLLWLPYTTIEYIKVTGDSSILDEEVSYLEGDVLKDDENEKYQRSYESENVASIYDHITKAIDKSLVFGDKNLPLMGSGDWNDGMNMVGNKGKGQSVWLGFFLYYILVNILPICEMKNDVNRINKYKESIENLKQSLNTDGWDGRWYKRAFFDDGTPLRFDRM